MTDTMESKTTAPMEPGPGQALAKRIATAELASELMARADEKGVSLVGPGGLLQGLTKTFSGTALEAEMTDHVGYEAYDPAG